MSFWLASRLYTISRVPSVIRKWTIFSSGMKGSIDEESLILGRQWNIAWSIQSSVLNFFLFRLIRPSNDIWMHKVTYIPAQCRNKVSMDPEAAIVGFHTLRKPLLIAYYTNYLTGPADADYIRKRFKIIQIQIIGIELKFLSRSILICVQWNFKQWIYITSLGVFEYAKNMLYYSLIIPL